jgi:hypothetical protein
LLALSRGGGKIETQRGEEKAGRKHGQDSRWKSHGGTSSRNVAQPPRLGDFLATRSPPRAAVPHVMPLECSIARYDSARWRSSHFSSAALRRE